LNSPHKQQKALQLLEKGRQFFYAGDLANAEKSLKASLKAAPDHPEVLFALGILYIETGRAKRAEQILRPCLKIAPDRPDVHNNYGVAAMLAGEMEAGFRHIKRATEIAPDNIDFQIDLSAALIKMKHAEDALDVLADLYRKVPDNLNVVINYAESLRKTGDLEKSKSLLEKARTQSPGNPGIRNNLGLTLEELGDFESAVELFREAIEINPNDPDYHGNLGGSLRQLGRYDEAILAARRARDLAPDDPQWGMKLAVLLLMTEQFEEGWPLYKERWETNAQNGFYPLSEHRWTGEALGTRTLLIRGEQGPGDEIVFATCLPDVIEKHPDANVILECHARLVPCFSRTFPELTVIPNESYTQKKFPPHDLEVGFGDLPGIFRNSVSDIENARPRKLISEPGLREKWQAALQALGDGLKIGIAWRGGAINVAKKQRSLELEDFLPVLRVPGCHFINLQYGDTADERARLHERHGITVHDWPEVDPLAELENQIAQIDSLDLVIQCSNTSAHIAAALEKPTWVAQAFSPYWLWFIDREHTPWYRDVRQFRPQHPGEWEPVVNDMAANLECRLNN